MNDDLRALPRELREVTASAIRTRGRELADDVGGAPATASGMNPASWRLCGETVLDLLAVAIESGELDVRHADVLCARFTPPLTVRQVVRTAQAVERATLDELALDAETGATSEPWPMVAHAVRCGILEVVAAFAARDGGRAPLRDTLTTLISRRALDLALAQEVRRARRHRHGIALIVFDIDDLAALNESHGYGAGDRLLERLGILARSYFRTHDWIARHGGDSLAALLPEATLDQAAILAARFCEMVKQRLVLVDHKTEAITTVTVSAAAVGTDIVQVDVDPEYVMAEADAAVLRAKMNGGNRVERVALLPTSVTIVGAATLLGVSARDVVTLLRSATLKATRRGRHLHIERAGIDDYKRTRETA